MSEIPRYKLDYSPVEPSIADCRRATIKVALATVFWPAILFAPGPPFSELAKMLVLVFLTWLGATGDQTLKNHRRFFALARGIGLRGNWKARLFLQHPLDFPGVLDERDTLLGLRTFAVAFQLVTLGIISLMICGLLLHAFDISLSDEWLKALSLSAAGLVIQTPSLLLPWLEKPDDPKDESSCA